MDKMKVGRNDPCPCRSGKKYKKCCGFNPSNTVPLEVMKEIEKKIKQQHFAEQEYGNVRPFITTDFHDYKLVAVGNQLHFSKKWETVHDFLGDYIKDCLGSEWGNGELKKDASEMHPIIQWYRETCEFQKKNVVKGGEVSVAICTGTVGAYLSLSYNLYLLRHHSLLQKRLIERLKNKDQFQGAIYELYVTASFIKAGFDIQFEDERDRTSSHCEFLATHKVTKKKYSVEAKSRHRAGFLGQKGEPQDSDQINLRIGHLLNDALKKHADFARIVFIDVNMPPEKETNFKLSWFNPLVKIIEQIENQQKKENSIKPAFLYFTNHPYHYIGKEEIDPKQNFFFTAMNMPEFRKNDVVAVEKAYPEIFSLWGSICKHTKVPHDFSEI